MFKKTFLILSAVIGLSPFASAVSINLDPFNADFDALMTGIARDVAPTLRLGALSGDLQADATIDHFSLTLPGIGISTADGLGKVLKPGARNWQFVLPLADLINNNVGSGNFFESLMFYPALKTGFGMGFGTWDISVSGFYFPQALVDTAINAAESSSTGTLHTLKPTLTFGNFGLQARKTLIPDSGWLSLVPALSLGGGYHYTFFDMGVNLKSLKDLGISAPSVGDNQTLDMNGKFGVATGAHVLTVDLHLSKHLLIFTPYMKLSGAYQNSTFTGNTELQAVVTDNGVAGTAQSIVSKPVINVSDFAFMANPGLEVNLFLFNLNVNVLADMSRAFLKVKDVSLTGIDANAFSINTGLRFSF